MLRDHQRKSIRFLLSWTKRSQQSRLRTSWSCLTNALIKQSKRMQDIITKPAVVRLKQILSSLNYLTITSLFLKELEGLRGKCRVKSFWMLSLKSTEYFQKTSVISFIKTLPKFVLKYKLNLLTVRNSRIRSWMLKLDRKFKTNRSVLKNSVKCMKLKSSNKIRRWNSFNN